MIACDWCAKKKEGKWRVVVKEEDDTSYGGKTIVEVVLCDLHYEPIEAALNQMEVKPSG
tara:strand:- start:15345 stop:15521 length:177 start_codon:yes stop_codon:yes gene_type:complete